MFIFCPVCPSKPERRSGKAGLGTGCVVCEPVELTREDRLDTSRWQSSLRLVQHCLQNLRLLGPRCNKYDARCMIDDRESQGDSLRWRFG